MKTVRLTAYEFDSLPAHIEIVGRGSGRSVRIALRDAVTDVFCHERLRWQHIHSFKMSAVVVKETAR
jgi:ActR/RegA family two-component response regulator